MDLTNRTWSNSIAASPENNGDAQVHVGADRFFYSEALASHGAN
jgi:hypothetical protein